MGTNLMGKSPSSNQPFIKPSELCPKQLAPQMKSKKLLNKLKSFWSLFVTLVVSIHPSSSHHAFAPLSYNKVRNGRTEFCPYPRLRPWVDAIVIMLFATSWTLNFWCPRFFLLNCDRLFFLRHLHVLPVQLAPFARVSALHFQPCVTLKMLKSRGFFFVPRFDWLKNNPCALRIRGIYIYLHIFTYIYIYLS